MHDASTPRKRFSRVCRDFETSRLEKALLAAAYERAVPTVSRLTRRTPAVSSVPTHANITTAETDFQPSLATERQAG
jgi:hypothetical protein